MYNRLAGQSLKAKCPQSVPYVRMHKHMQRPCYSKLRPQVYGMELQSLASIFAYCLKGGFSDKPWGDRSLKHRAEEGGRGKNRGGGREGDASTDHTISNPQTLSTLKCHSCNQPFHLRAARSSTPATQDEPALKLKGFRQLGPLTVTICMLLSFFLRSPSPEDCCCCRRHCRWGLPLLFPSWNAKSAGS